MHVKAFESERLGWRMVVASVGWQRGVKFLNMTGRIETVKTAHITSLKYIPAIPNIACERSEGWECIFDDSADNAVKWKPVLIKARLIAKLCFASKWRQLVVTISALLLTYNAAKPVLT